MPDFDSFVIVMVYCVVVCIFLFCYMAKKFNEKSHKVFQEH